LSQRACLLLVTTSLLASPALAQSNCAPEKLTAALDAYATAPFGARAWRKLNGLGDPGFEGESYAYDSYSEGRDWGTLMADLAPGNNGLANPAYNCRIGYPLSVLQSRIATYGKTSDYVRLWLKGQEAVVNACAGQAASVAADIAPATTMKPDELASLKFDQAYQQASILFYRDTAAAVAAFKAIAATASPHKAAARYNVANIFANAKNVVEARSEAKAILADASVSSVHGITKELLGYIANQEDSAAGWAELIDATVETLSQPASAFQGQAVAEKTYTKALYDIGYAGVTAKQDDWWITNTLPQNATLSKAIADAARKRPMVMWMMAGQSVNKPDTVAPWAMRGTQWQSWAASYVDRAMALQAKPLPTLPKQVLDSLKANTDDASRATLWSLAQDAANKATANCGDAPETAAVIAFAMQALRISAQANRYDEIYANLPKLNLQATVGYKQNLLPKVMQHILASGNVEEGRKFRAALLTADFLKSLQVKDQDWQIEPYAQFSAFIAEDKTQWVQATGLMGEKLSSTMFNLLPASGLRELGHDAAYSAEQQAVLRRAAWTRNYARGIKNSDKNTLDMLAANPALATMLAEVKNSFPTLSDERSQLLTILRNPRFGLLVNSPDGTEPMEVKRDNFAALDEYDVNDKNWWCPLEVDRQLGALRLEYDQASGLADVRSDYFKTVLKPVLATDAMSQVELAREALLAHHPMLKAVDWKEVSALAKAPSAPELLTKAAIRWGKAAKGDDAAAEALALAVWSTRYGCRWHGSHQAYSKPAQELLKAKFGTTSWAAQTPYWFACMDSQYDANYNKVTNCKPRTWPKQAIPK
jgi:hypothetical protein